MSKQYGDPPHTERVETAEGVMIVLTPCHSAQVLVPPEQAVPGEALCVVCPLDGIEWSLRLVADEAAPSGLRAVWADPEAER